MGLDSAVAMLADLARWIWPTVLLGWFSLIMGVLLVAIYRTFFHPLARVPGPKLAAISNIWHARQIARGRMAQLGVELHQKYGDIVRVGPNEVWFNTTEAFDQIYCMSRTVLSTLLDEYRGHIGKLTYYRHRERIRKV